MLETRNAVEDKWGSAGVVIAPGGWCACTCCWCHCHISSAVTAAAADAEEL